MQHQRIMSIAAQRGVRPDNVFYYIHRADKSYSTMALAHREATGTPVDHYLDGAADLASKQLGPDTMVVILDDVAGSGDSLVAASGTASRTGYKGQVIVSPMVSTQIANTVFTEPGRGVTSTRPNTTYVPGRVMTALKESPFFRALSAPQQWKLEELLNGFGFDHNGLSMAFPYMAPDNNNVFFADQLAREFIINRNQEASKNLSGKPWSSPRKSAP
jgi:hypothetical protein